MTPAHDRRVLAAQTLADVTVADLGLAPPVPVEDLVVAHADIRRLFLEDAPDLDAVVHGLRGGRARPVVVLNEDRPETRIRFTLAHELGHLMLAWHIGTIECHVEDGDDDRTGVAVAFEREADAFAARLLVPARFVREIVGLPEPDMLARLAEAQVSPDAGLRSLAGLLPPGHVLVLLDGTGTSVASAYRSPGTDSPWLSRGSRLDTARLGRMFARSGRARHQNRHVWWGTHGPPAAVAAGSNDWQSLLTAMVEAAAPGETRGGSLWKSANGVASNANGSSPTRDVAAIAAKIRQRFLRRDDLQPLVQHPLFDEFVAARARAFASGQALPGRSVRG